MAGVPSEKQESLILCITGFISSTFPCDEYIVCVWFSFYAIIVMNIDCRLLLHLCLTARDC